MPYSALEVANKFINLAKQEGRCVDNMKLQKLVFLSQGYCSGILGKDLFVDDIRAWKWGPVVPPLYRKLKKYGAGDVTEPIEGVPDNIPSEGLEMNVISSVWNGFKNLSGPQLSALTHKDGSPWAQTEQQEIIRPEVIREFYHNLTRGRVEQAAQAAQAEYA